MCKVVCVVELCVFVIRINSGFSSNCWCLLSECVRDKQTGRMTKWQIHYIFSLHILLVFKRFVSSNLRRKVRRLQVHGTDWHFLIRFSREREPPFLLTYSPIHRDMSNLPIVQFPVAIAAIDCDLTIIPVVMANNLNALAMSQYRCHPNPIAPIWLIY